MELLFKLDRTPLLVRAWEPECPRDTAWENTGLWWDAEPVRDVVTALGSPLGLGAALLSSVEACGFPRMVPGACDRYWLLLLWRHAGPACACSTISSSGFISASMDARPDICSQVICRPSPLRTRSVSCPPTPKRTSGTASYDPSML